MFRLFRILGVALAAFGVSAASAPAGSLSAITGASAQIVDSGGIQVLSPLVLPSVIATSSSAASFSSSNPSAGTIGSAYGASNARLTIRSEAGEALSLTVPPSFTVVRLGGGEALTVTTSTSGDFGIVGDGVLMSGAMMNGVSTSVDIGGKIALASAQDLVPGPYEGLFAVTVEYN